MSSSAMSVHVCVGGVLMGSVSKVKSVIHQFSPTKSPCSTPGPATVEEKQRLAVLRGNPLFTSPVQGNCRETASCVDKMYYEGLSPGSVSVLAAGFPPVMFVQRALL